MPAVQTSYSATRATAFAGMIVDAYHLTGVLSRSVKAAAAFGSIAVESGVDDQVQGVDPTHLKFVGVIVADSAAYGAGVANTYAANETAPVLRQGLIWVTASVAVVAGEPAYFTTAGAITNVASGNTAIPNGRFDASAGAGALVPLRIG